MKLLTSWENWPSDGWFAALSLDLCRDLRRNVRLALSLVLDSHLSGSAARLRISVRKTPRACSTGATLREMVPYLCFFPYPGPILSARCMAMRQSVLQVPVCQNETQDGLPARSKFKECRCQGCGLRQVLGAWLCDKGHTQADRHLPALWG